MKSLYILMMILFTTTASAEFLDNINNPEFLKELYNNKSSTSLNYIAGVRDNITYSSSKEKADCLNKLSANDIIKVISNSKDTAKAKEYRFWIVKESLNKLCP